MTDVNEPDDYTSLDGIAFQQNEQGGRSCYRAELAVIPELAPDSLVGSFFLTPNGLGDGINWQGLVVAQITTELYLVQLFSWITGGRTDQKLIGIDEMTSWDFYDTSDEMVLAYEKADGFKALPASREANT